MDATFEEAKGWIDNGHDVYYLVDKMFFYNKIVYPQKSNFMDVCPTCGGYSYNEEKYREAVKEYRKKSGRFFRLFKEVLFYYFKVEGKKAEKAFQIAWDVGHAPTAAETCACGFRDVLFHFEKLTDLLDT
jgi:hypothetical protein